MAALLSLLPLFPFMNVNQGCLTQLFVSTSNDIESKNYKGEYFEPFATLSKVSKIAANEDLANELWSWTEEFVKGKGFSLTL